MNMIFDTGDGRKLALYENKGNIYMNIISGESHMRPTLLSSDFSDCLSSCVMGRKLYYAYLSTNNHIKIKSIDENAVKWEFDEAGTDLFLTVYEASLILFYFKNNELTHKVLFGEQEIGAYSLLGKIYERQSLPEKYAAFYIDEECKRLVELKTLEIKKDYLFTITSDLEEKYAAKQKSLKESYEENIKKILEENELKIRKELEKETAAHEKELEAKLLRDFSEKENLLNRRHTQKIKELNATIESIKLQYEQLMNTATKYKEDAAKWHRLYQSK